MLFNIQLLLIFGLQSCVGGFELSNIFALTDNFFSNLNRTLSTDGPFTEPMQKVIENQIDNYLELIKRTHGLPAVSRSRRSLDFDELYDLPSDSIGVYILNGFEESFAISAYLPKDIILFKHSFPDSEIWYAATIESLNDNGDGEVFVIYLLGDDHIYEVTRENITRGVKLESYTDVDETYIVVAENHDDNKGFADGSGVYHFDGYELMQIQTLHIANPSDLVIWEDTHDVYMAVTQRTTQIEDKTVYEFGTPIYKWLGKHFDIIDYIETQGAQKIVAFKIGQLQYLAVANYQNDNGETDIYSEIFRHDVHDDVFVSHQKILTHGAVDVKYFCFKQNNIYDNYLVFANSFELDYDGNRNDLTNSIIYKQVDDFFIPFQSILLNNVEEWLPVVGPNGEFILMVACKYDGIKIFQYDGWRFIETNVEYSNAAFGEGVITMHPYIFHDTPVVVIANENDNRNMIHAFKPVFVYENSVQEYQDNLHKWCQNTIDSIDLKHLEDLNKKIVLYAEIDEQPTFYKDHVFDLSIREHLNSSQDRSQISTHSDVKKENPKSNYNNEVFDRTTKHLGYESYADTIDNLNRQIADKSNKLNDLSRKSSATAPITIDQNVHVNNLHIKNTENIAFNNVAADFINRLSMNEFFDDIFYLDAGFDVDDNLEFEDVIFDGIFNPRIINDNELGSNDDMEINGDLITDKLIVNGFIDDIKFDSGSVLLHGEQTLDGTMEFPVLRVDSLELGALNDVNVQAELPNKQLFVDNVETLNVKHLKVASLNGHNVNSLKSNVLQTRGDQEVNAKYSFDTVIVQNFQSDTVSDIDIPNELVLVSGTPQSVTEDLCFTNDLSVNEFHIRNRLNQIASHKGKLDLLLKTVPETQYVTGTKTFDNVDSVNFIGLRGVIQNDAFDAINPLKVIEKNLTLQGDFLLSGNVVVKKLLNCDELVDLKNGVSSNKLFDIGLRIDEREIPVSMQFLKDISVNNLYVKTINNMSAHWINVDDKSVITGTKHIDNLHCNGATDINIVNDVDAHRLFENSLKANGNQIVTGNFHFSNVKASRLAGNIFIDETPLDDIMLVEDDQFFNNTFVVADLPNLMKLEVDNCLVEGKLWDNDISALLADTVFMERSQSITGKKHIDGLTCRNLYSQTMNGYPIDEIATQLDVRSADDVPLDGPIRIPGKVTVERISFRGFNGLSPQEFGNVWLTNNGNFTVSGNQFIEGVRCNKSVTIQSGYLSKYNLSAVDKNAVRVYERNHFENVIFQNPLVSLKPIRVKGALSGLNLSNDIFYASYNEEMRHSSMIFNGNLQIYGDLFVNGSVNGFYMNDYCKFSEAKLYNDRMLIINGSVTFENTTDVTSVNTEDLNKITKDAWYVDENSELTGYLEFNDVYFQESLDVDGYVDEQNLKLLWKNYISKTKKQTIFANMHFENLVILEKDLTATYSVLNHVNSIDFDNFYQHALRNEQQTFHGLKNLQNLEVFGTFDAQTRINNLDLSTDVMRSDVSKNIVTGRKTVNNLSAAAVQSGRTSQIQNVQVNRWLENIVNKNGQYRIDALKTFENAEFKENVQLLGLLNSLMVQEEAIMLKSFPQKINAQMFLSNRNVSLMMDNVVLRKSINGFDFAEMMSSKINKSETPIVVRTSKTFQAPIHAKNVIFDDSYNGYDMKRIISDIVAGNDLLNLGPAYTTLADHTLTILSILSREAYFLSHYKSVQAIAGLIVAVSAADNNLMFVTNNTGRFHINVYSWDERQQQFVEHGSGDELSETEIQFITFLTYKNTRLLFVEYKVNDLEYSTNMYVMDENSDVAVNITTHGISDIISVPISAADTCILIIDKMGTKMYCNYQNMLHSQELYKFEKALQASSTIIYSVPYIFVISDSNNPKEDAVDILRLEGNAFALRQTIYVTKPTSVDSICYKADCYVAIGTGRISNAIHPGVVTIRKFDKNDETFVKWQDIITHAATEIKFAVLPSDDLILYILTDSPTEPLIIYMYKGVSGFQRKVIASTIPRATYFDEFTLAQHEHFAIVGNNNAARIIKAVFKGNK